MNTLNNASAEIDVSATTGLTNMFSPINGYLHKGNLLY